MSDKTIVASHDGGMRFVISTGSGHEIVLDDGVGDSGPRPTEALLAALVACTAMDTASILTKKRQVVTAYTVEASGQEQERTPRSSPGSTLSTSSKVRRSKRPPFDAASRSRRRNTAPSARW